MSPLQSSDRHFQGPMTTSESAGAYFTTYADMQTMNIQISFKFHVVCVASKMLYNYNNMGLKEIWQYSHISGIEAKHVE